MSYIESFILKHDRNFVKFQKDIALEFIGCKTYILEWFKFAIELELKRRYKEDRKYRK